MSVTAAITDLQAKVRLITPASTAAPANSLTQIPGTSPPGAPGTAPTFHFISPQTVISGSTTAAIAYTTFNAAPFIPNTAQFAWLTVLARRDKFGSTGYKGFTGRANAGSQAVTLWQDNSDGTDADTEGYMAQVLCPISSAQTFDWAKDNGPFHYTITLIGYFG